MTTQDCPEPLRRYLDVVTGRLRFRSRAMTFSRWTGLIVFGVGAVVILVSAIVSSEGRLGALLAFLVLSGMIAWMFVTAYCDRTDLERVDAGWLVQRRFLRWSYQPIHVRDADVMTEFVRTTSSWPDFDDQTSLVIEFHALPFAGAPKPVEILKGYGLPKMDLAHLGKLVDDFAKKAQSK